ncbi:hypothetical protein EMIT047CA2_190015 [Pseudomonas soli]
MDQCRQRQALVPIMSPGLYRQRFEVYFRKCDECLLFALNASFRRFTTRQPAARPSVASALTCQRVERSVGVGRRPLPDRTTQ